MEQLRWACDELGIACLVNLHQVQRLRRYEFILRSGRRVPVSERRYGQVRQEYLEWQARFEEWAARL